jgi:hypothetical protein
MGSIGAMDLIANYLIKKVIAENGRDIFVQKYANAICKFGHHFLLIYY